MFKPASLLKNDGEVNPKWLGVDFRGSNVTYAVKQVFRGGYSNSPTWASQIFKRALILTQTSKAELKT